jgi:hypothetical protein
MSELRVVQERSITASAKLVYFLLVDFQNHHHRFLPPQFSGFKVEKGGYGAGTEFSFVSLMGGQARPMRMRVEEKEPGRVLIERDLNSPMVTTTTVTPDGQGCTVRFETVWQSGPGFIGLMERLMAPGLMRRMYADELQRLEQYAKVYAANQTI